MRIRWNDTGLVEDRVRCDAQRMIRRGRAVLAEDEPPKPEPKAEEDEPPKPNRGPRC